MNCLFLVSDEGFGHTVRQSCIANELAKKGTEVIFQCRDPIHLASKILNEKITIHKRFNLVKLVKQKGGVDVAQTYHKFFQNYINNSKKWIEEMVNSSHVSDADLIVTDIVEEAGALSKRLEKPVVAISHFTWHWLLHELGERFEEISQYLEQCLDGVTKFLYPPFSKCPDQFPNSEPINIIARTPKNRDDVRKELQVGDDHIVVLFAGGGTSVWKELIPSLKIEKKKDIVLLADLPTESDNIKQVPNMFRLHDYVNASDLVISRGGYGTISETLAYGIKHVILLEKNHPETIENARLLKDANRTVIYELKDFLDNPIGLIDEAINNSKINSSSLRSNGNIQAINCLFDTWENYQIN